ncbi:MAG: hypothetical protein FJ090_04545 [Deltaproteobacteria bacterium]|nr:hypothetical protein [Deltaproteobacteria bacterium]
MGADAAHRLRLACRAPHRCQPAPATGLPRLASWISTCVTSLGELRWNEVLLYLFPLDLLLPWLPGADRYAELRLAGLAGAALLWAAGVLVQPLGPMLLLAAAPLFARRFLRPRSLP